MATRYWPFGPHGSVGNNLYGIGDQWRALNAAGVPAFYKGADGYGPLFELMQLADDFDVPNVGVFRLVEKNGINFDVPNWGAATPEIAAAEHVQKTLANLPIEFDKRVWLELINEPDKDTDVNFPDWESEEFADWLGRFAQQCANLLLPLGYKLAMFGFSAGEPEIPDWETEGMLGYLQMCGEKPGRLAVALHEYSYNADSLEDATNLFPWQIGRFGFLFDVCDAHGIKRPTTFITEFGWTLWELPSPDVAIPQLEWAANEVYGPHANIKGVAVWHFGSGFNDIRHKAQKLLQPMADIAMDWRMEVDAAPTPPPPPDGSSFEEQAWAVAEFNRVMEFMPEAALQKAMVRDGFVPVSNEYRQEIERLVYAGQLAERLDANEKRVYMALDGDWGNVFFVSEITANPEPPEPPPQPPEPPEPPLPPVGNSIDLVPYFMPEGEFGPLYEVRDEPTGAQRRIQHQRTNDRHFYITKGTGGLGGKSEWEELHHDDTYIWRGIDTSPGHGRFYVQYENGLSMARWCKRHMKVGETYIGVGHKVQFFNKADCSISNPNSGTAMNITTLFAHHGRIIFNGLVFDDVIELGKNLGERFWFARGIGMIGWKSAWNESYVSELHDSGSRPNNEKEPICNFTLP